MEIGASTGAGQGGRLSWRDPAVRWLLVVALILQVASWWLQRGYPLADAVEFMDRARAWVAGEPVSDARTVRSFAFSGLFVPPFLIARAFGLADLRPILLIAQLLEVALALGLVLACARLAERVAGRSAGLAVGCIVAMNPLVLQYGVQPISGIAAALCLALGLDRLIVRGTRRDGWVGGLWLGLAFLVAYQSLLISLAIFLVLVARDRWAQRRSWLGLCSGLAVCMALQLCLDRFVYGEWQGSLWRYLLENVGYVIVHLMVDLGMTRAAGDLYGQISALRGHDFVRDDTVTHATMRFGSLWYVLNAPRFFVWPLLLLFAVGVGRALVRPRWTSTLALTVLAMAMFIMAKKGDKSLRLCLPLLPLCAPLFASAWSWCSEGLNFRRLARLALIAALPLSWFALVEAKPRAHAAYWDAADWINEQAASEPGAARMRCASAFDWAVFLRLGPRIEKVKLADTLDRWKSFDDAQRAQLELQLDSLDWLILHQPLLISQPGLLEPLAARFCVAAAFYDLDEGPDLGAVLVLRRVASAGQRLLEYSASPPKPHFTRRLEFRATADAQSLYLLGFDLAALPGTGWWWITYHWELPGELPALEVRDRITSPDERNSWQNDHALGRGMRASRTDERFLSEGFLFVPSAVEQTGRPRFRPMGGEYRRGDLLPLRAWIEVLDPVAGIPMQVQRANESASAPDALQDAAWKWSADGYRFSKDGLVQIGGFFLPVHPRAQARDTGKPIDDSPR